MSLYVVDKDGKRKITGISGGGFPYTLGTYLDVISTALHATPPVAKFAAVASNSNIDVSSPGATIGGLSMSAGMRVLLANQTAPEEEGLWVYDTDSTPMSRPADFAAASAIHCFENLAVGVIGGTYAGAFWVQTATGTITIDTTAQAWSQISLAALSGYQPLNTNLTDISGLTIGTDGYVIIRDGGVLVARALVEADISDFGSYQPAGSYQAQSDDLDDIAALAHVDRHFIVSDSGVWIERGIEAADLPDLSSTYQPLNSNLTTIAGFAHTVKYVIISTGAIWECRQMAVADLSDYVAPIPASYLDTDGTLAANSDAKVPSQKAVKTYVDTEIAGVGGGPGGGGGGTGCNLRMSLSSSNPYDTNSSAAATLYIHPIYDGNVDVLVSGVKTTINVPSAISIDLTTYATTGSKPYDVFVKEDGGGGITFELIAWTNDSTRATALVWDTTLGYFAASGATNKRYLGTFYTDAAGSACTSTAAIRHLENALNKIRMDIDCVIARNTNYSTTSGSWTAVNSNTTIGQGKFSWIEGLPQKVADFSWKMPYLYGAYSPYFAHAGLGYDGSNPSTYINDVIAGDAGGSVATYFPTSIRFHPPGGLAVGHHTAQKMFYNAGSSTTQLMDDGIVGDYWG